MPWIRVDGLEDLQFSSGGSLLDLGLGLVNLLVLGSDLGFVRVGISPKKAGLLSQGPAFAVAAATKKASPTAYPENPFIASLPFAEIIPVFGGYSQGGGRAALKGLREGVRAGAPIAILQVLQERGIFLRGDLL